MFDLSFYQGKNVFLTGHTGFKGSWMSSVLTRAGANVTGYALEPTTKPALFNLLNLEKEMNSIVGDIRNYENLHRIFDQCRPDIVIHLAAQPLVRESYRNPVYTYETNVMGTVNLLECVRNTDCVRSFLNVTTDKVYKNKEWIWGYRENEELNGYDPYSNSKSCSELVTGCYKQSFLQDNGIAVSTARAGNVIGGGDFAEDRIIPDCIRAAEKKQEIVVRNPFSTRPYQHVLEPVFAYLLLAQTQYHQPSCASNYNVGPEDADCITTGELVDLFCEKWAEHSGESVSWVNQHDGGPHEANFLQLDCSKIKAELGWKPIWNVKQAVDKTTEWAATLHQDKDIHACMQQQISEYMSMAEKIWTIE